MALMVHGTPRPTGSTLDAPCSERAAYGHRIPRLGVSRRSVRRIDVSTTPKGQAVECARSMVPTKFHERSSIPRLHPIF